MTYLLLQDTYDFGILNIFYYSIRCSQLQHTFEISIVLSSLFIILFRTGLLTMVKKSHVNCLKTFRQFFYTLGRHVHIYQLFVKKDRFDFYKLLFQGEVQPLPEFFYRYCVMMSLIDKYSFFKLENTKVSIKMYLTKSYFTAISFNICIFCRTFEVPSLICLGRRLKRIFPLRCRCRSNQFCEKY